LVLLVPLTDTQACPDEETLLAFVEGRQTAAVRDSTATHLDGCHTCRDVVAMVAPAILSLTTLANGPAPKPKEGSELVRGATVGRYVVLSLVGRGGMGEVYAAYDPELDRKIALKLLLSARGTDNARAQARLLREAKAIAKLSHPNVIVVYDAGTFEDRVFVGMEFVEGQTVKDWLSEKPRSRSEILEIFTSAARGLGAAHAAGLVHRDFKPHNVMVGKDGTVRVMDFGLARQIGVEGDPRPPAETQSDVEVKGEVDLTRTGELLGTPLYMAPEQFKAERTDARTDQFSFCVALYGALYGAHPFGGTTLQSLIADVLAGKVHPAPPKHDVPAWLRRVLLRGLSVDPAARWPSMDDLIAELARDPARSRQRWALAAGAALSVAAVAFTVARGSHRSDSLCRGGPARLVGLWEPASAPSSARPHRDTMHAAFLATGLRTASETWDRVAALLDRYTTGWLGMYHEACEAAQVRGEQSAETLDLRMTCLEQRRTALAALTDVLATADSVVVDSAVNAANALPAVDACADLKLLRAAVAPPRDEKTRARVEDVRTRTIRAKALKDTGKLQEASRLGPALVEEARAIGYKPLLAEVLVTVGEFHEGPTFEPQSNKILEEGVWTAVASHRDDLAAEAAALLIGNDGYLAGRIEDGLRWVQITEALLDRLGEGHDRLRAWSLQAQANIKIRQHDFQTALALTKQAVALKEKALTPDHPDIALSILSLAEVLHAAGKDEDALVANDRALTILVRAYGENAVTVAQVLSNRGEYLVSLGRAGEAVPIFRDALALWEAQVGHDHPYLAYPLTGLGQALLATNRGAAAIELLERARRLREAGEANAELVGETRFALARALAARGSQEDLLRARALASAARDDYQRTGNLADKIAAIDRWLAAQRGRDL
jgi:serine/threonine protein kinase/tetratricopeptide (TPR) repeat protein